MTGAVKPARLMRVVRKLGAAALVVALVVTVAGAVVFVVGTRGCSTLGAGPSGERLARMQRSPHWQDGAFANTHPNEHMGSGSPLGWLGPEMRVPPCPLPLFDRRALLDAWKRAPPSGLRVTWLGHSTAVIELDGARILTDPQFSERASPVGFAGPARFHPPVVDVGALGHIDAVLISHDHYDHLDMDSVRSLSALTSAPFIVGLGVGARLESWGVDPSRIVEVDWGDAAKISNDVTITSTPSQHFSGRFATDQDQTLWTSYAIVGPAHRAFFSGDTGLTPELGDVGKSYGPFDVALVEIGQWNEA